MRVLGSEGDAGGMAPSNRKVVGGPATLLRDGNGREIGRYTGPTEWDSEAVVSAIRERLSSASATASTEN